MRAISNVLTNWVALIIGTAITFVLSPYVVHHLGETRYGIWALVGSVVGYLGLLDLGVRIGITRFVARYAAQRDQAAINRIVTTAFGLFVFAGILALAISVVTAVLTPRVLNVPAEFSREVAVVFPICGAAVAVGLIGGVYGGIIAGLQRFALLNAIDLGIEMLRAAAVFVALGQEGGLAALALIQLAAVTVRGLLYAVATRRLDPDLRLTWRLVDLSVVREIVRFSGYTTILHVLGMVIFQADAVLIAAIMPVTQVTLFVIAGNLCEAALRVLGGVSRTLFPMVSARQGSDGSALDNSRALIRDGMRLGTLVFLPIIITFLFRGETFIRLWMGPELSAGSGRVLEILAIGLLGFASYRVFTTSIMALNFHRGLIPIFVAEAVMNVALSIALGLWIGVAGVAWGTTIPRLVVSLWIGPWYARRMLAMPAREYGWHAFGKPMCSVVPFALATMVVERYWPVASLTLFFAQVAAILPLAMAGAWMAGITPRERGLARRAMAGVFAMTRRVTPGSA